MQVFQELKNTDSHCAPRRFHSHEEVKVSSVVVFAQPVRELVAVNGTPTMIGCQSGKRYHRLSVIFHQQADLVGVRRPIDVVRTAQSRTGSQPSQDAFVRRGRPESHVVVVGQFGVGILAGC